MIGKRHFTDVQYAAHVVRNKAYGLTEKGKQVHSFSQVAYFKRKRLEVIEFLGSKCVRCGFSDIRALQLDHINGGGCKESKSIGSTTMYLRYSQNLVLAKEKLQVLCANCNWIKRYERDETVKGRHKQNAVPIYSILE